MTLEAKEHVAIRVYVPQGWANRREFLRVFEDEGRQVSVRTPCGRWWSFRPRDLPLHDLRCACEREMVVQWVVTD